MAFLSYKTFVWPQNPHTYREEISRAPWYFTEDGITYFGGMGGTRRIITGEGTFYGEAAFESFKLLMKVAEETEAGDLRHPVWGLRHCYLTKLELIQEPRENVVSYRFEFTQAGANGEVPK